MKNAYDVNEFVELITLTNGYSDQNPLNKFLENLGIQGKYMPSCFMLDILVYYGEYTSKGSIGFGYN